MKTSRILCLILCLIMISSTFTFADVLTYKYVPLETDANKLLVNECSSFDEKTGNNSRSSTVTTG